ncbi:MAG: acyl-CoA thioesterase [Planctomycetota bacterium]
MPQNASAEGGGVELRVRYAETDGMGVAYHAHFLTYFEVARTEYLRRLGAAYREMEERGFYLVVVEAHCRYMSPARYDDLLTVTAQVERLRPTRVDFHQEARRKGDGRAVAEGHLVLACVDAEGRPQALPPEITTAVHASGGPPQAR